MAPVAPALTSISAAAPAVLGLLAKLDLPKKDYIYGNYITGTLKPIILSLISKQKLIMKLLDKHAKGLASNHTSDLLSTTGLVISMIVMTLAIILCAIFIREVKSNNRRHRLALVLLGSKAGVNNKQEQDFPALFD